MNIYELAKELFGEMRDLTEEERENYNNYIKSISTPTGINFWDLIEGDNNDDA
jgi:hypothetical protein